jgi:predicted RNA-binding Zn-ribbon protein involved in translation (DUF1610 family)
VPRARTQPRASKRGAAKRTATTKQATTETVEFTCPECGRKFTRAAALGAHRSRAHGVAGKSAQAKRSRKIRQGSAPSASTTTRSSAATTRRTIRSSVAAAKRTSPRGMTVDANGAIDRDALLNAIFPSGMPAREEVIRAATGWLDEAERVARM